MSSEVRGLENGWAKRMSEIVCVCTIMMVVFAAVYIYPFLPYFIGMFGLWVLGVFRWPIVFLTLLIGFVLSLLVSSFIIVSRKAKAKPVPKASSIMFASAICLVLVGMLLHKPWHVAQVHGFRAAILKVADIDRIRQWAANQDMPSTGPLLVNYLHRPPFIKRLDALYVQVYTVQSVAGTTGRVVEAFSEAKGLPGRWGLVVGPKNMITPESTKTDCVLPLAPGAYVFHDAEPKSFVHMRNTMSQ